LQWLIVGLTPPEGLTAAQLNQWKLDQAHKRAMQIVMEEIRRVRGEYVLNQKRQEYVTSYSTALEQVKTETALVDEPEKPGEMPIPPPLYP